MAKRMDAKLERYTAGGYCLTMADGSQFEADTAEEAISFAHAEGVTRVYSAARPEKFVLLCKEDI